MKVNVNKIHATIMAVVAVLMLSPCLVQAQDTSRNFVRTVTMLNAGGTDSLQAVQYYNGFGRPTVSVAYQFPRPSLITIILSSKILTHQIPPSFICQIQYKQ